MVPYVAEVLRGSDVHLASVATSFPSGQAPLEIKLADTRAPSRRVPTRSTW